MDIEKLREINRKQVFETGSEKQFIRAKDIEWLIEQIYQLHEEKEVLKTQVDELIGAIYEYEPSGTYLYDLAEQFDDE